MQNLETINQWISFFSMYAKETFNYKPIEVHSWRGSYDEAAVSIEDGTATGEEWLEKLENLYNDMFYGYKGGQYFYDENTPLHFEYHYSECQDLDFKSMIETPLQLRYINNLTQTLIYELFIHKFNRITKKNIETFYDYLKNDLNLQNEINKTIQDRDCLETIIRQIKKKAK